MMSNLYRNFVEKDTLRVREILEMLQKGPKGRGHTEKYLTFRISTEKIMIFRILNPYTSPYFLVKNYFILS